MNWDSGGAWVLLLALTLAIEVFAIVTRRRTLSEQVWAASRRFPVLVPLLGGLGLGMLIGHFWL